MVPTDFTNNQNAMGRVIWGYIYTLKSKINIRINTWNFIFNIKLEAFAKFGGQKLLFIKKRMYSLSNDRN